MSSLNITYGHCHCGCGRKTKMARNSWEKFGWIAGQPLKYIHGHNRALPRAKSRIVTIKGKRYRTIPLQHGLEAIVDLVDFNRVRRFHWHAVKCRKNATFYVSRWNPKTKSSDIHLHSFILGLGGEARIDHRNRNGLDNRRCNLRPASYHQNGGNRRKNINGRSKYKGVCWSKLMSKWSAGVGVKGKNISLGYFRSEVDAAKAYDTAARKYFGEFARLNFPRKGEAGCLV